MDLGAKLHALRLQNELTLEDLAARSELSKGFLSQVERNLTSPSIDTLTDILDVLGVSLGSFFQEQQPEKIVFTKDDYFLQATDDYQIQWLAYNTTNKAMEPILFTLAPHAKSELINPFPGQAFGYVLKSEIKIAYGKQVLRVRTGESFYVDGNKPQQVINPKNKPATIIWVATASIF